MNGVEARLQRIEADLRLLEPLRRLAAPAAPDILAEWARVAMVLLRSSAVSQPPDQALGLLTKRVMDALLLANGKTAGSA